MTREEILAIAKPILFNTDMVQAILQGRKTVTRRLFCHQRMPDRGDYLYVRETWCEFPKRVFHYRADFGTDRDREFCECTTDIKWHPSIHMPKEAARIFLRVTYTGLDRLHLMTLDDFLAEGVVIQEEAFNDPDNAYLQAREQFIEIWNATTTDLKDRWEANPWVWVIEFERVEA